MPAEAHGSNNNFYCRHPGQMTSSGAVLACHSLTVALVPRPPAALAAK